MMAVKRDRSSAEIVAEVILADQSPEQPVEGSIESQAEKPAGKLAAKRVKTTYTLKEDLDRWIKLLAVEEGIPPCEVLDTLLRPMFKGVQRPKFPADLRARFRPDTPSAA